MGIIQRDSFRISVISYAGAVIGYLNKIFLFTNFLDTDQVGLANLMVTIALIYAQVAALGSRNVITRFFPFFQHPQKGHHGFLFGVMVLAAGGFVLSTLAFLFLRRPFSLLYYGSSPLLVEYAVYIVPLALATLFYNIFESYLRCVYKNVVPSLAHEVILRLMVTVAISLYAFGVVSFPGFVTVYVAAYCVPALLLVLYAGAKGLLALRPGYSVLWRRLGRIMIVYGMYSLLNNLSSFLLVSIDSLMVAGMIDLGAAGIYTTMVFMTSVMLIPYRSMVKVSGPLVARLWKLRALGEMAGVYRKATAGNLVVGSTIFLLLWVNLGSIFHFMAPEYAAGRYVFLFLGLGKLFDMGAGLNATILNTSRKYRYDLYFTVAMVVFAIAANRLLIPLWGKEGAAVASMLTLFAFNALRVAFIRHHFGIAPYRRKQLWVPVILGVVMAISSVADPSGRPLADIPLRSAVAAALFLFPVWYLRISPELNRWAGKKAGVYTTIAWFYLRRKVKSHPLLKKRWRYETGADKKFEEVVAGIPSEKVFVHVALSSVRRFSGAENPYRYLMRVLEGKFRIIASQAFTPQVRKTRMFDPQETKPAYGEFASLLFSGGGYRNHDPCYSVVARGDTGFPPDMLSFSPDGVFRQMVEEDYHCINIGLDHLTCSMIHLVEYEQQVPYLRFHTGSFAIRTRSGIHEIPYPLHDNKPAYSVKGYVWWNKWRLMKDLRRAGIHKEHDVAGVRVYTVSMRALHAFVSGKVRQDPYYLITW